jgi:hypothetical protein
MVGGKENKKDGGIQKAMISRSLKYTLATAILLAVMLVVTVVPVASAKTDTAAKPVDGAAIDRMIEKLEPYVARCDDGTFRLDIPKGAKIHKTSAEFKTVSASMEYINSLIQEGIYVTTPDLSVYSVNDGQFVLQSNNRNEYKPRWYGFELWVSHPYCQWIEMGALAGDVAAAFAAIFTVTAPLAALLAIWCTTNLGLFGIWDNGCGIHFKYQMATGVPVPFYFAGQTCD